MRKLVFLFILCSFSTWANVKVSKETNNHIILFVSESYTLGDNDTMTDAKSITTEQAKKSASDYAGSYVESELKLLDGKVTKQQIRVLSAGYIEVLSRSFDKELSQFGKVMLNSVFKIRVSKKSIVDGINKLKSDPERQAKMAVLSKDNQRLRKELLDLTKKINSGASRQDLSISREGILKELNANRLSTQKVFDKGVLLQLANISERDYELAKKDVDDNYFGYYKGSLEIYLGQPSIEMEPDGKYTMSVPVSLSGIYYKKVGDTLDKYFNLNYDDAKREIYIRNERNSGKYLITPYSKRLLKYIKEMDFRVVVYAGSLAGSYRLASNHSGVRSSYNIPTADSGTHVVRFENLTDDDLENVTSLSVSVMIDKK